MKAADTSPVVAAFASWHEHHEAARQALDSGLRLIEHCALETCSVLTRLPAPHRGSGRVVQAFLETRFPQPLLRLSATGYRRILFGLAANGVSGGAAHDALTAATAVGCKAQRVSCDRRALSIYERCRVQAQLVG